MTEKELKAMTEGFDEEVEEFEETVGFGESSYIVGYQAADVKVSMAKLITIPKSKVQFIELDFETKDGKTLREKYMLKGKTGTTFFMSQGKKRPHFGLSKIKSLINVLGLYGDNANKMKALFSNTEVADVTYTEYGKEKTEEFVTFTDLIGSKCKILVKSKKVNQNSANDEDDAYMVQCVKDVKAFAKEHPKKKAAQKWKGDEDYFPVYRWFTETAVDHFCTTDGLLQSEMESGEGKLLDKWLGMSDEGQIYDTRVLIVDDLSEGQREKLGIDQYGKIVETESSEESYDEPTEEAETDTDEDW